MSNDKRGGRANGDKDGGVDVKKYSDGNIFSEDSPSFVH